MRKKNNIIRNAALAFLAVMLPVSCQLEKDGAATQKQNVMIELEVSAGNFTKAVPSETEAIISSLNVYAYLGSELVGDITLGQTESGDPFMMDLLLPDGKSAVDFYLVANASAMKYENDVISLPQSPSRDYLEGLMFSSLSSDILPLYAKETKEITVNPYDLELSETVTFELSRSLAKLSVYAAKSKGSSGTPQVLSVELLANGTREFSYLFPQTDDILNAVESRANNISLLNAPVAISSEVQKGSSDIQNPENYDLVLTGAYLPEVTYGSTAWNVSSGNEREAVLHVAYTAGNSQDRRNGYIYLPAIKRNDHINVCILISADGQIVINYTVAEWDWDKDKMQDWFFDYPTHTYVLPAIPLLPEDALKKPDAKATMKENKPFVGYFQMTYPESDKWIPTLEGLNASKCSIKVYNDRTGREVFSSDSPAPLPVSDDWYRIEVSPKSGYMDQGDVVNLAITYTPSGLAEIEYLLINGSYPEYFWPESTSENYMTITMVN